MGSTDIARIKRLLGPVADRLAPAELEALAREEKAIERRRRTLAEVVTEEWDFEAVVGPDGRR